MALLPRAPSLAIFAVSLLHALASPLMITFRSGWVLNAVFSAVGMCMLLFVMPIVGGVALGLDSLGEEAIILIVPLLIFPVALAGSGILRLIIVKRGSGAGVPAAPLP